MDEIEELLQKPYWIIDILPKQVPNLSPGQYSSVEQYFLKDHSMRQKKLNILLKLNCYYDILVQWEGGQEKNPAPEKLKSMVAKKYLNVLIGKSLIVIDHTDTYMTAFNVDNELFELLRQLAAVEGMFVWKP